MVVGQITAKKIKVCCAPIGDQIVIVTIANRTTDHQKQHFRQRMGHTHGSRGSSISPKWSSSAFSRDFAIPQGLQGSFQRSESTSLIE